MKCKSVKNRIPEFIEGELTKEQSSRIEQHLDACEVCRAELRAYQHLYERLGDDHIEEPSPFFWSKFNRELHTKVFGQTYNPVPSRGRIYARGFAVATAVAVFFIIGLISQHGGRITIFGEDDSVSSVVVTPEVPRFATTAGSSSTHDPASLISDEAREAARVRLANMEDGPDTVVMPARSMGPSDMRVVTDTRTAGVTPAQRLFERTASRK
jgi:predicted anti-sigma-YlaC factor YlaD